MNEYTFKGSNSATRSLYTQNKDQLFKERTCSLQSKFLATEQHPSRNVHPVMENNRKSHKYIPFTGRSSAITIFAPPPTQDQVKYVTKTAALLIMNPQPIENYARTPPTDGRRFTYMFTIAERADGVWTTLTQRSETRLTSSQRWVDFVPSPFNSF